MKPRIGDIVRVDRSLCRVIIPPKHENINKKMYLDGKVINIHEAKRPYDIEGIDDGWGITCPEGAILEIYGRNCDCESDVVYSEKQGTWVCPFCLE